LKRFAYDQFNEDAGRHPLPRRVQHALSYLRSNAAEKVTLSGLAVACAIPERTILKQFRKFVGLSPLAYLRRHRLNLAREELLNTDCEAGIADIAINCGFTHLGRFATAYRSTFGESPSGTRQRVRFRVDNTAPTPNGEYAGGAGIVVGLAREKPSLIILPMCTETLRENLEARDLTEQLAAALSRMRLAAVTLARPSHPVSMNGPRPRNAGTQYCLRSRLTQRGESARVVIRLIDVAADRHLWGDSFDGSVNDPFELRDRIIDSVTCNVVATVTDAEIERACDKDPASVTARDLAMQALPLILATNVPSTRKAINILNRAIELDPANALSVALLACCQAHLGMHYGTPSPASVRNTAMRLAQRAGVLDDRDPLVTLARGAAAAFALQSHDAETLVTRAVAMDPTSSWAWERRGMVRLGSDPDGAIADLIRAQRLRGPSLSQGNCLNGIAAAHAAAGRLEEALLWQRKALAANPAGTWMYILDTCYALKAGHWSRVVAGVDCLRRAQPGFSIARIMAAYPPADPAWLEALPRAGMPLT
jgi:AraC-like DNA-binding protein/TolB-like protein